MSAPVKLPLRLTSDASPRLDLQQPPDDPRERVAYWLRRAIRHCERWAGDWPGIASCYAWQRMGEPGAGDVIDAGWLPSGLRLRWLTDMRRRLAELESGAA